jgi:hypothetical protein
MCRSPASAKTRQNAKPLPPAAQLYERGLRRAAIAMEGKDWRGAYDILLDLGETAKGTNSVVVMRLWRAMVSALGELLRRREDEEGVH